MSRLLELPIVGGVVALLLDVFLAGGDLILTFLVYLLLSIGDLLPILSVASAYIAPELEWLDRSLLETALFVVALIYVGVLIARLLTNFQKNND